MTRRYRLACEVAEAQAEAAVRRGIIEKHEQTRFENFAFEKIKNNPKKWTIERMLMTLETLDEI